VKRLAIVPGRSGSKRLPNKNIRNLAGIPLICHTVNLVRTLFDQVIVSSDTKELLSVVHTGGSVITDERPEALATDTSKVIDTVCHYFDRFGGNFDQIWLCLPTCPLRAVSDIESGFQRLDETVDGVVSVTEYEFPPALAMLEKDGLLIGKDSNHPLAAGNSRSQDQEVALRPNGAFYGMWCTSFDRYRNFFRGRVRPCYMPRERSVDIDTNIDFRLAELLLDGRS